MSLLIYKYVFTSNDTEILLVVIQIRRKNDYTSFCIYTKNTYLIRQMNELRCRALQMNLFFFYYEMGSVYEISGNESVECASSSKWTKLVKEFAEDLNFGTRRDKVFEILFIGANFVRILRQFIMNGICVRSGCGLSKQKLVNVMSTLCLNWMQSNASRCVCNILVFVFFSHAPSSLMSRKSGELTELMYHTSPWLARDIATEMLLCEISFHSLCFHFLFRAFPFWHVTEHSFGGVWVWVCWVEDIMYVNVICINGACQSE